MCVAFMLLELVLVITKRESIPSRLIVLVDTSESMGLNDPYPDDETQSQLASKLGFEARPPRCARRRGSNWPAARWPTFLRPLGEEREVSHLRVFAPVGVARS